MTRRRSPERPNRRVYALTDRADERRAATLAVNPRHEAYDWISIDIKPARYKYPCISCDEPIPNGLRYRYANVTTCVNGMMERYYQCARCYSIAATLNRCLLRDHVLFFNFDTDFAEHFGALPDEVAALAFMTPYDEPIVLEPAHAHRHDTDHPCPL